MRKNYGECESNVGSIGQHLVFRTDNKTIKSMSKVYNELRELYKEK